MTKKQKLILGWFLTSLPFIIIFAAVAAITSFLHVAGMVLIIIAVLASLWYGTALIIDGLRK